MFKGNVNAYRVFMAKCDEEFLVNFSLSRTRSLLIWVGVERGYQRSRFYKPWTRKLWAL